MKRSVTTHLCLAGILALSAGLAAQGTSTAPQAPTRAGADQVTITGCVVSESEYRKAHDAGRGGVVGTGVGAGNEFILTEASTGSASAASTTSPGATGTSGTSAAGTMAYELSGAGEGQLSRFVGRRVELTGKFKSAETSAAGQPTGGPTAGAPPRGVDVGGQDLKLREFDVATVREATGACSPAAK
jgi:hypothetical protein